MSIKLTNGQEEAMKRIRQWLTAPMSSHWKFVIAGLAGTGKTTLLQALISSLDRQPFVCCAPTGKAASVLQSKLPGLTVRTAHSLLYVPQDPSLKKLEDLEAEIRAVEEKGGNSNRLHLLLKEERRRLARADVRFKTKSGGEITPGTLVIVDEASMVSESMLNDFERTGCRAIFVGDSGQLPPVKDSSWFIEYDHDVKLTEIMRQALESPIIRLSIAVRGTEKIDYSQYKTGDCIITKKDEIDPQTWLDADQIITGGNASRRRINKYIRKRLGFTMRLPQKGDKLICLKNDHYKLPPWINGVQFKATGDLCLENHDGTYRLDSDYGGVECAFDLYPYHCLMTYDPTVEELPREDRHGLFEADYAYAVTCHKSQGSEWPFVLVADDQMWKERVELRRRWLYTAITRAKEKLIICQ